MKKTILIFGLISGAISSLMMVATVPFADRIGFDKGAVIGYASIVLAFFAGVLRDPLVSRQCWQRADYLLKSFCCGDFHHSDFVHLLCGDLGNSLLQLSA